MKKLSSAMLIGFILSMGIAVFGQGTRGTIGGQVTDQNDGNFLEIMCAKFGGIRCHPRLAVPEKLPKNGPKSGVCLRGYKMVSF